MSRVVAVTIIIDRAHRDGIAVAVDSDCIARHIASVFTVYVGAALLPRRAVPIVPANVTDIGEKGA